MLVFSWHGSFIFKDKKYLVVMVDPDAPTQKPGGVWVHWIANNVPVSRFVKQKLSHLVEKNNNVVSDQV